MCVPAAATITTTAAAPRFDAVRIIFASLYYKVTHALAGLMSSQHVQQERETEWRVRDGAMFCFGFNLLVKAFIPRLELLFSQRRELSSFLFVRF